MFMPFEQEYNEFTNKVEGTGLGLTIVKNLVEIMGGTIECESEPMKGTTFTIDFDREVHSIDEAKRNKKNSTFCLEDYLTEAMEEDFTTNIQLYEKINNLKPKLKTVILLRFFEEGFVNSPQPRQQRVLLRGAAQLRR